MENIIGNDNKTKFFFNFKKQLLYLLFLTLYKRHPKINTLFLVGKHSAGKSLFCLLFLRETM